MANPTTTGPYRPDLHKAIEAFVDAGFAGLQLRLHDDHGEWVGSAGVRQLGDAERPPTNGRFWAGSATRTPTPGRWPTSPGRTCPCCSVPVGPSPRRGI